LKESRKIKNIFLSKSESSEIYELFRCDGLTIDRLQESVNGKNGGWKIMKSFLGAFAKLRKATISFVMSVCLSVHPSVRMEQFRSHRMDYHEILYFGVFRKSVDKVQVPLKSVSNKGFFI
jgi:hypothetical protein